MTEPYRDLIAEFCAAIQLSPDEGLRVRAREGICLPGRLPAGELAIGAVACVGVAATLGDQREVVVEPARVSAAFRSDQLMRINDHPIRAFAPGSGYFPTAGGWIRTHANSPITGPRCFPRWACPPTRIRTRSPGPWPKCPRSRSRSGL